MPGEAEPKPATCINLFSSHRLGELTDAVSEWINTLESDDYVVTSVQHSSTFDTTQDRVEYSVLVVATGPHLD